MEKTFSVIIPSYNRGYILWKSIQSVQKQIYPFWELIIVDDGSTDDTKKVVSEFHNDARIKYVKTINNGVSNARNIGMKHAIGKIITYLDSDDTLYDNFLSTAYELFEKNPEKIFAIPNYNFRVELYDDEYKLIDFARMEQRQGNDVTLQDIYHWKVKCAFGTGLLHKRVVIDEGIQWDKDLQLFDDWDFAMQLAQKYPEGFLHIPYVLYEYTQRYGTDGLCSNRDYEEFAKGFDAIYQKHKDDIFMQGQSWYPHLVNKYKEKDELFKHGKLEPIMYKYFPDHFKKK